MKRLALGSLALLLISCGDNLTEPPDPPEPCRPGLCECTLATEEADCGAHQYCDVNAAGSRGTCQCVAGYTNGGGDDCVWAGVIRDPAITRASEWTGVNGATIEPDLPGELDPGEARFTGEALCRLASIEQTVEMPAFAKAQPLMLELSFKNQSYIGFPPGTGADWTLMGASFGGTGWTPLPVFRDPFFHRLRICLPEGGFAPRGTPGAGAPVTFAFGPYQQPTICPSSPIDQFTIDHVNIVAAGPGECGTAHGEGPGFDAERTEGWLFESSPGQTAGFASGIGVGGSRAARVGLTRPCAWARMETRLDVPAVGHPALEMFVGASAGARPYLYFGGQYAHVFAMQVFDTIPAAATTRTVRMCLPPSLRGQVLPLSFGLESYAVDNSCSIEIDHHFYVDDLRVVDDPACGAGEHLSNAGFEHSGPALGATVYENRPGSLAVVRSAPGQAHGGTQYLALESRQRCTFTYHSLLPTVPVPSGGAGPALKFFANVGVNSDALTLVRERGRPHQVLAEGGGYQPYTLCLNPVYAGRPQLVSFVHHGGSGEPCDGTGYGVQAALLDSFEVTTDPACPAQ